MGGTILEIIKYFFKVLSYILDPNVKRRAERAKVFAQFQDLQKQYRQALADGKPQLAARVAKEMQDLRDQYEFLNVVSDKGGKDA